MAAPFLPRSGYSGLSRVRAEISRANPLLRLEFNRPFEVAFSNAIPSDGIPQLASHTACWICPDQSRICFALEHPRSLRCGSMHISKTYLLHTLDVKQKERTSVDACSRGSSCQAGGEIYTYILWYIKWTYQWDVRSIQKLWQKTVTAGVNRCKEIMWDCAVFRCLDHADARICSSICYGNLRNLSALCSTSKHDKACKQKVAVKKCETTSIYQLSFALSLLAAPQPPVAGAELLLLAQAFVGSVAAAAPVVAPQVLQALEGSVIFLVGCMCIQFCVHKCIYEKYIWLHMYMNIYIRVSTHIYTYVSTHQTDMKGKIS